MASFVSSNEALLPDQPLSYSSIPALEPLESVFARRESYAGPTNESNWVIPGRLLGKIACSGHGVGVARRLYLTFHLLWPHVGAACGGVSVGSWRLPGDTERRRDDDAAVLHPSTGRQHVCLPAGGVRPSRRHGTAVEERAGESLIDTAVICCYLELAEG